MRLDDDLLREAKKYAAEKGMTLTALLDGALREVLARQVGPTEKKGVKLPTFKGKGLQPGVDLDDSASLVELMDRTDVSS